MWHNIYGHDDVIECFRRTIARGRLASTYLFVGPPGIGKRRFALELAKSLLCLLTADEELESCGKCESCCMFAAGNHPDLEVCGLRPNKTELAISQFVGYDEFLKQDALCHRIALKPFFGGRRVAIIDDADHFNLHSANCLLKTLEEPPPHSLLILIGTSPSRQLPTIRSRVQVARFRPLDNETVSQVLLEAGLASDPQQAKRMAQHSEGSIEQAVTRADPALWEYRDQLLADLPSPRNASRMARGLQAFVDEAGTEPALKRVRLRVAIAFAIDFFRAQWPTSPSDGTEPNVPIRHGSGMEGATYSALNASSAHQALDLCLTELESIDRNANLGLVIQHWCEGLADLPPMDR